MNGGTASVTNDGNANWQLGTSSGPASQINMNGGTFYVGKYDSGRIQGTSKINMAGGKIIVTGGDRVANVQADITAGRYLAFGAPGDGSNISVDYNVTTPNMTTIQATGGGGGGGNGCPTITTFDNFNLDALYGWSDAIVQSTPTNYIISDTGYGSGYKGLSPAVNGSNSTTIVLDVTLSSDDISADGKLGPIVRLADSDGTEVDFPWYGQTLGNHILTNLLTAGNIVIPGTTPGLNVNALTAIQLQLDPSSFTGTYTVAWNNLGLSGCGAGTAPAQKITNISVSGGNVSITYQTTSGFQYHLEQSASASPTSWSTVSGSTASGTGSPITFSTPQSGNTEFYRSVSP